MYPCRNLSPLAHSCLRLLQSRHKALHSQSGSPKACTETRRGREEEKRKKMGYLPYLSTETWTLLVALVTLITV